MESKCYVCGTTYNLHRHHVFYGTSNRKNSEKYNMVVCLCAAHHNMSNEGVHRNRQLDLRLKKQFQSKFENEIGLREDFMKIFGKNYL